MRKRCVRNKAPDESASADEEPGRYEPGNVWKLAMVKRDGYLAILGKSE